MNAFSSAIAAFRTGEGLKGQLLRGGVGSLAVKIGSTLLNVLMAVVLARALGAEGFGIYSFVFALITIMAIPAQMGLPNLVVRETAKAQAAEDWALIRGLWRWASLMALAISALLMALGAFAAWMFAGRFAEGQLVAFYWGLVLVPLIALGNLRGAALRGLRHVVQGQLPEYILRPAFLIVLVLGAHLGLSARALTASDAMMLHAVASLIAFAIGAYLLLRARPSPLRQEKQAKTHPRPWLASALPLGMMEGIPIFNQNVSFIVLGISASAAEVGLFRVAWQGALLVAIGVSVVEIAVAPYVARLSAQKDVPRLRNLLRTSARASVLVAFPIVAIYALQGAQILKVFFGAEFIDGYTALLILAAARVVAAAVGPVNTLLIMIGQERIAALSAALAAICNAALAILLVPTWGLEGAAIASAASTVVWNLLLLWQAQKSDVLS